MATPVRAAAGAASVPAWPPARTITSNGVGYYIVGRGGVVMGASKMTVRGFRVEKYIEFSVVVNCFIGSLIKKQALYYLLIFLNSPLVFATVRVKSK